MRAGPDRQEAEAAAVAREEEATTVAWLAPTIAYVLTVGALGVATKLALEDLSWQQITLWTTLAYLLAVPLLLARRDSRPHLGPGFTAALASGALAVIALVVLFVALGAGDVGQVVPVTSAYPVVTLILASAVLGERVTRRQVAATGLIIGGVILLSVS